MAASHDANAFALVSGLGSKTGESQSDQREFRLLAAAERKFDETQARTQEHLAELERVMSTEIKRRTERDAMIQDMVESNVRLALEKMVGAWQVELTRLQRRIESEFRDRCQQLEHDAARMKHQVGRLEGQLEVCNSTCRRQAENITRLESRVVLLEELVSREKQTGRGLDNVERMGASLLQQSAAGTDKMARLLRAEMGDLEHRFASFEQWFSDTITPELVACRAAIEAEQRQREDADEEMANVMGRYAKIMQRHFAGGFPTGLTALLGPRAAEGVLNATDDPDSP